MRRILLLPIILILSSCAPATQKGLVTTKYDEFTNTLNVTGPSLYNRKTGVVWTLQTIIDKNNKTGYHYLKTEISYFDLHKRYYLYAIDDKQNPLSVEFLYKEGHLCPGAKCPVTEIIKIQLKDKNLRAHLTQDYQIKVTAKSEESVVITMPSKLIKMHLAALP